MLRNVSDLDLKLLKIFRVVAHEQGFSAAADALNTSLSSISMNMSDREARLGMRVCDRGIKGFRLTPDGEAVLAATDRLQEAIQDFTYQINSIAQHRRPDIHIGVLSELLIEGKIPLPQLVKTLQEEVPGVNFNLSFEPAAKLQEGVKKGRLHFALGYFFELGHSISKRSVYQQRLVCCCSKEHPLYGEADEDIDAARINEFPLASFDDLSEDEKRLAPLFARQDATSRTSEGIMTLVLTGSYLGLISEDFAEYWVDQGLVRVIEREELSLPVEVSVIYKKSREDDPAIQTLLSAIDDFQ